MVHLPDPSQHAGLREELLALNIGRQPVGDRGAASGHFLHAVTVDEYLALRQSELETHLMQASIGGDQESLHKAHDRSFPMGLLATPIPGPVRYWTAMGVPLMDPAIRHRVYSHMTRMRFMPRQTEGPDKGVRETISADEDLVNEWREVYGMSVNLRIDPDEAALLSTLDVSVITDRCESFTQDLLHYAAHVRAVGAGARPQRENCTLGG